MKTIGQAMREARQKKGMPVKALAEAIHVAPRTVYDWEEDRHIPPVDTAADAARALGISIDAYIGRDRRHHPSRKTEI